ncbi:MAG: putative heme-binding protein [Planctomycetota bacterium]|nr:putative heme-binding protein [Planctomycetota bacterium]
MRWIVLVVLLNLAVPAGESLGADPLAIDCWPAGPFEVRVTYDRPLDPAAAKAIVERAAGQSLCYYTFRRANNQGTPGTHVVTDVQSLGPPLGQLRISGARVTDDGKTLVLATDPHPRQALYVLDPLIPKMSYDLSGIEATWHEPKEGAAADWSGVFKVLEVNSGGNGSNFKRLPSLVKRLDRPGRLVLRTTLGIPKGPQTLVFESTAPFEATAGVEAITPAPIKGSPTKFQGVVTSEGDPIDLTFTVTTGKAKYFTFNVTQGPDDPSGAVLSTRMMLPWVPSASPAATTVPAAPFSLTGGDPKKGEAVFRSEAAKCASCHSVGGKGGSIGPSLDELKGRDLAEVYFHIAEPSARILPEYMTYTVARKGGEIAAGIVRGEGFDAIRVSDIGAKVTIIPKADIEEMRPSSSSTMPVGLPGAIGEASMRDLLAFLTKKN